MKTTKQILILVSFVFTATLIFTSCEDADNDATLTATFDSESAEEDALIANYYEDIYADMEDAENDYYIPTKSASADPVVCRSVTYEKLGDTLVTLITYNGDCQFEINGEQHYRSGSIKITRFGGRKFTIGATRTIELIDYVVDSVAIEGVQKIVSNGLMADSTQVLFNITLQEGKVTLPDGRFATRNAIHTRLHIIGDEWFNRADDEFYVNGTDNGLTFNGLAYQNTLLDIHKTFGCPFFDAGTMVIEVEGQEPLTVNYGDGECDRVATCQHNGASYEISLVNRWWRIKP